MRILAYLLIAVGFLGGAYVAVLDTENRVDWNWFVPPFLLSAVGVAIARYQMRREATHEGSLTTNMQQLRDALQRITREIDLLDADKTTLDVYSFHERIDATFPVDLARFVEARKSIGVVHGLEAYADVMNEFAAGERYLNRVWSASVDGYIDEVLDYVGRARHQFNEALRKLLALEKA